MAIQVTFPHLLLWNSLYYLCLNLERGVFLWIFQTKFCMRFLFRNAFSHASLMSSLLIWPAYWFMMKYKNCVRPLYVFTFCLYFLCLGRNFSSTVYPSNLWNAILLFLGGVTENTDGIYLINSGGPRVENGQTHRTALSWYEIYSTQSSSLSIWKRGTFSMWVQLRSWNVFWLRDVGSTYLTGGVIRTACWITCVLFVCITVCVSLL
jgi:hypothetical protein